MVYQQPGETAAAYDSAAAAATWRSKHGAQTRMAWQKAEKHQHQ